MPTDECTPLTTHAGKFHTPNLSPDESDSEDDSAESEGSQLPSPTRKSFATTRQPDIKGQIQSRKARTGDAAIQKVADAIKAGSAKNVVVLTGAGISTAAGIPDFRSPHTGLYHNLERLDLPFPEAVFELNFFRDNPKPFWILAKELYPGKHYPTLTHYFLVLLAKHNVLRRVFTQNIDTLEQLAGLDPAKVVEAHGSFATAHCTRCRAEASRDHVLAAGVRKGQVVRCVKEACDGLVKPDIVFFGEGLPDKFFSSLPDLTLCDLLIVIGTSLTVQPFSMLPGTVTPSTPRLLINREAVGPFSQFGRSSVYSRFSDEEGREGDMYYAGDADDGVRRLAKELGWMEELDEIMREGRDRLEAKWAEEGVDEDDAESKAKAVAAGVGKPVKHDEPVRAEPDSDVEELQEAIERDLTILT